MQRISSRLILGLLILALAACGRPTHQYTDTKDVKIHDISHVTDGEFLIVTALLKNSSSSSITHTVYRVQWFDANGALLEQSSWRPVAVKGGNAIYIKERSTVPGAKEYTILISNDAS